ncbi:acyl-CoA thioesterase [Sporosarcina sp. G11-34]|uniref:acyl-CoA thioesterase n=1 Tax=Sporosarcina sp. G11-34 TaxID=2849605 RepID=UPI0022A97692|nr:acyl-CoA thioesterase [Sporosarcina sp. G11-34]MCZ2258059.1 acyl-CoA thioesterase [Sporosarcina sp. G11-34]
MRANYITEASTWASEFSFSVPVTVRFSETDMFGHLNNTVPFTYFEFARIEYLKHLGLMNNWLHESSEKMVVVADLQCDFLKQVFFDESLRINVKMASVGTSSGDIHYMATDAKDEIVFTGRGSIVQINKVTGKGEPWTEEEKSFFVNEFVK